MQSSRPIRRLRATNENASSFASKIPTVTEPTNDGVLNLAKQGNLMVPQMIKLWPILLGSNDDVSSMRIIGWHQVLLDGSLTLWLPTILGEFVCTASTCVGVALSAVLATEAFCDTIVAVAARNEDAVIGAGTAINSETFVLSPTNNTPGHIVMNLRAMEKLEITSDQTTGTSTFNCLYSLLGCD